MNETENTEYVLFHKNEIDVLIFAGQRLINMYDDAKAPVDDVLVSVVEKLRNCKRVLDEYEVAQIVPELKVVS